MASIIASDKGSPRELIPVGNYVARCYQMIEIGTVTEIVMGRQTTAKKVRIGWELPEELRTFSPEKGEQPLVISTEFTVSLNSKSNLRKTLASWRGKDFTEDEAKAFDILKLLGAPCMLNIIHKNGIADPSKVYEKIASISPIPKGMKAPKQVLSSVVLTFDGWNDEVFASLPEFVRERVKSSSEFQEKLRPGEKNIDTTDEPANDLPF